MADDNSEIKSVGSDVDRRIAFLVVVVSIVFFRISNLVTSKYIETPPRAARDPWRWRNLFVSWIHAILCGSWDIMCFTAYPEMLEDLDGHMNYFTYTLVAFSTGYFIYDALDMFFNNRLLQDWGVTLHHIIVLICFIYSIWTSYATGIVCVALLVEVNGVFLHARKLMQIFQFSFEHKIYVLNKYINLITFVIFRGGPISRVFYEFAYKCPAFNLPLRGVFIFLTVAMACINVILFWRLCKSDVLLTSRRKYVKENS